MDQGTRRKLSSYDYIAIALILSGLIIVILFPFLFTRSSILNSVDFTDTGQIGDTIGGITAPFIGLISAGLVYLSFRVQIEANRDLKNEILKQENLRIQNEKFKNYEKNLDHLSNRLSQVDFKFPTDARVFHGSAAIQFWIDFYFGDSIPDQVFDENLKSYPNFTILIAFLEEIIFEVIKEDFEPHQFKILLMAVDNIFKEYFTLEDSKFFYRDNKLDHLQDDSSEENKKLRKILKWWMLLRQKQYKLFSLSKGLKVVEITDYPYDYDLFNVYTKIFKTS